MMYDLVIQGGQLVLPGGTVAADLGVKDGRITAIGTGFAGADTVDATGLTVTPGGVDPHCHIEQISGMGQMNADTFETATRSAAMGGTTTVISFAAQQKGEKLSDTVANYAARARRGAAIDHAFHILISDTSVPDFEADLTALFAAGHRSIKVFTTYNIKLHDAEILEILRIAAPHGVLTCVHAENDAIIAAARAQLLAEGKTAPIYHAASRPRSAEIEAVSCMCRLAEETQAPVMIFHVSTAEAAAEIAAARARGAPIWAETCPHYLLMTEDVLDKPGIEGAKWMCSPPQRRAADQVALWQALRDGVLQVISSDHAPYRFDETGKLAKGPAPAFPDIANGLPGLEPRLPLMMDRGAVASELSLQGFARLTSEAPARIYGLPGKGKIEPGCDADLVLWDLNARFTYGPNDLHDNVGYNPWAGREVIGTPIATLLRGQFIMRDGQYLGQPGEGRWLARPPLSPKEREI